jgi:hypothetical protein
VSDTIGKSRFTSTAHKKASGITGGLHSLTVFFIFFHLASQIPEHSGNHKQNDCQKQLHQHINLL